MAEITILGNQNSNLNSIQINEARCFFSFKKGNNEYYCGLNSDEGKGCKKTLSELITIWEAEIIKKNQTVCKCDWIQENKEKSIKKCPKCKGIRRVEPILVINEKIGNGLHREVDGKLDKYGNICLYCKSCQMIWDRKDSDLREEERSKAEYTTRKSKQVREHLPDDLKDELAKTHHYCYGVIINHWTTEYNCAQKLIEQTVRAWLGRSDGFDLIDIKEYGIDCQNRVCTGEHIVLAKDIIDHKIIPKQTDYQAFLNE